MFIDYLKLHVCAGNGGNGRVGFRKEKYIPRGGPDGGDGGRGGHIIFQADPKLGTLLDLKFRPNLTAKHGGGGGPNNRHGADAEDIVVPVPLGTLVSSEDGVQLADLTEPGERWIAAKGGRGGKGNARFATATLKTPLFAQDGREGQHHNLILELKLIADAGLVGLPNAGKSTLLSKLTSATPKIAPYPFTTLNPNLGVLEFEDLTTLVLADLPGLIEGASKGVGLGDRFLRHIERTGVLVHLVGDEEGVFDPEEMLYKYDLVREELEAYTTLLAQKKELVLISKLDLADPENLEKTREAFRERGIETLAISSVEGQGLEEFKSRLRALLEEERKSAEIPSKPEGSKEESSEKQDE